MNWYAIWSLTVAVTLGTVMLALADPLGHVWRKKQARIYALEAEVEIWRAAAIHRHKVLMACAKGEAISFPDVLVFCDPQQAPIVRRQ